MILIGYLRGPTPAGTASGTGSPGATPTPSTATASAATASVAPSASGTASAHVPSATARPTPAAAVSCRPTDQDRYVYNPDRLRVLAPCLRVAGVVEAIRSEADGDLHVLLALDPPYAHYLTPANQGVELGDLVVEPICVHRVTQADAVDACAADPDPLRVLPGLGVHIWMEGRYVLDLDHGGWAELHPLYRWGPVS